MPISHERFFPELAGLKGGFGRSNATLAETAGNRRKPQKENDYERENANIQRRRISRSFGRNSDGWRRGKPRGTALDSTLAVVSLGTRSVVLWGLTMIEMFKAGYDGLKAAVDIAKGIEALKTETAINQAVIDIQRNVLEAQRALTNAEQMHAADLKRVAELEQKIAGFEAWESEKQRYQLEAVDRGAFAYVHKPGMESGEPPMWLCQTCLRSAINLRFSSLLRIAETAAPVTAAHIRDGDAAFARLRSW